MLLDLLGSDFAIKAPPDLLLVKHGETHPTNLADLHSKRLVCCVETEDGRRLAESLVKELTGGDRIRARRMREDFWEFTPTHKIWLAANHKPVIRGTDLGIWRRVKLIPFSVTFADDRQDKALLEKLLAERSGILNWALAGCVEWHATGLGEPTEVNQATADYRTEMDVLGDFLTECCVIAPNQEASASELFCLYRQWCERNAEQPINQRRFGMQLTERGIDIRRGTGGKKIRIGIGIVSDRSERSDPTF